MDVAAVHLFGAMGWQLAEWAWTRGTRRTVSTVARGYEHQTVSLLCLQQGAVHEHCVCTPVATLRLRVARRVGLVPASQMGGS